MAQTRTQLFNFEWNSAEPQAPAWFQGDADRKGPWVRGGGGRCLQASGGLFAAPARTDHISVFQVNHACWKEEASLLTVDLRPPPSGGAVEADPGPACCSVSALRRVRGHEAVRLSPPAPVVPRGPGSRVGAPAVPPAGGRRAHPAAEPR